VNPVVTPGNVIALIAVLKRVHVVVCVATPPPLITIVGALVKPEPANTILKLVKVEPVKLAFIITNPPPLNETVGAAVNPDPPF